MQMDTNQGNFWPPFISTNSFSSTSKAISRIKPEPPSNKFLEALDQIERAMYAAQAAGLIFIMADSNCFCVYHYYINQRILNLS